MIRPSQVIFDREKGTLLLAIAEKDIRIPKFVEDAAKSGGLVRKPEFHITVIGFSAGQRVQKSSRAGEIEKIAEATEWQAEIKEEFYKISKTYGSGEHRESVIALVHLSGLEEFIKSASNFLGI